MKTSYSFHGYIIHLTKAKVKYIIFMDMIGTAYKSEVLWIYKS